MSEPPPPPALHEPRGLEFLELLESRHNHVLTELELLNERIQTVLSLHSEKRTNEG
jgi:hypothetical protein